MRLLHLVSLLALGAACVLRPISAATFQEGEFVPVARKAQLQGVRRGSRLAWTDGLRGIAVASKRARRDMLLTDGV